MIKKFSPSTLLILFALSFPVLAQDSEEDITDFGSPNQTPQTFDDSSECALSKDSELINLLNFKLSSLASSNNE